MKNKQMRLEIHISIICKNKPNKPGRILYLYIKISNLRT